MPDQQRLLGLLDVFEGALRDFTALARRLDDHEWDLPTDLPGWTVRDLVSHTAHLEAVLAGTPEETTPLPDDLPHVKSLSAMYTEQGVLARRTRSREELLDEIATAVGQRLSETRADPPTDGSAMARKTPGDLPWSWNTLLSNRPLDVWMHEQDIRRATDRPGNLDSDAARHVVAVFGTGLGYVLGKKAGGEPGQGAAVALTDGPTFVVLVGEDGRGQPTGPGSSPDTTLRMSTESFVILCGGRRAPSTQHVEIEGDSDLGERLLAGLAVTP